MIRYKLLRAGILPVLFFTFIRFHFYLPQLEVTFMIKKIAAYMLVNNPDTTLYPPVATDSNTDFYVLTNLDTLKSDFWQIKIIPNLLELENSIKTDPKSYLGSYDEFIYIEPKQIITGKLSEDKNCIMTVPSIKSLLPSDIPFMNPVHEEFSPNPSYSDGPYNGYPLQLSICLPISNRRDTLYKCLDGLKPLLENLDAELIVVDTSNDGSTEIAQSYGAKIIPFTWINDFAAARNVAIREAKGSWILSIDDDEWFDDTSEIITFFQSEQWKQCDTAFYKVRNYTDPQGSTFGDSYVQRMAKNHTKLHYIYPIHEAFDFSFLKDKPYSKYFNSFVHHYGYAYSTAEDREKKIYRNIAGIYTTLQLYPFNLRQHQQLCNELTIIKNYNAATAYTFKLLSLCKLQEKNNHIEALHWKRIAIIFLYTIGQISCNRDLISMTKKLTNLKEYNAFQLATIHYYLAANAINDTNYDDVCIHALEYYKKRSEYLASPNKNSQSLSIFTDLVEPTNKFNSLIISHAYALLQLENKSNAEKVLREFNYNFIEKESTPMLVNVLTRVSEDAFFEHFPKVNNDILKEIYISTKNLYLQNFNHGSKNSSNIEKLTKLDERITATRSFTDNPYVNLIHLYAHPTNIDNYTWFLSSKNRLRTFIQDITICATKNNFRLLSFLPSLNFEGIQQMLRALHTFDKTEFESLLTNNLGSINMINLSTLSEKELIFTAGILETALFNKQLNVWSTDTENFKDYFIIYAKLINLWSLTAYNKDMFLTDNFELLPATTRGAHYMDKAFQTKNSEDINNYIQNLKNAVTECPLFEKGVKLLLTDLKSLPTQKDTLTAPKAKTEFELLGEQLKGTAKQLIDAGKFEEAKNILLQLSKLLPEDKDIVGLLSSCKAPNLPN